LCSQPTVSRLENLPSTTALKRMMAAMVELFCDSFERVPDRIVLDIDDTCDPAHGGQHPREGNRAGRWPRPASARACRRDRRSAGRLRPSSAAFRSFRPT
jgi:hypothetical protein